MTSLSLVPASRPPGLQQQSCRGGVGGRGGRGGRGHSGELQHRFIQFIFILELATNIREVFTIVY